MSTYCPKFHEKWPKLPKIAINCLSVLALKSNHQIENSWNWSKKKIFIDQSTWNYNKHFITLFIYIRKCPNISEIFLYFTGHKVDSKWWLKNPDIFFTCQIYRTSDVIVGILLFWVDMRTKAQWSTAVLVHGPINNKTLT